MHIRDFSVRTAALVIHVKQAVPQAATICLRLLQLDNIFVFIRQVAPVPAC